MDHRPFLLARPVPTLDLVVAAVEETHVSVVVLFDDVAVKLKKPIQLPFLDWRRREAREAVCHREVALNRRLAPDVYLGVLDVVGEDGAPVDHLVLMRRMPDDRRLSRLVTAGADVAAGIDALAALVARFHTAAERSPAITRAAGRDAVRRNWDDNLAVLHEFTGSVVGEGDVERVDELAHRYLAGRAPLFEARGAAGCAVDGHGDLLADDIYLLDDGPRVLDCLEFSDELRSVDVLDDVAFLAMDLERLGRADLARSFLDAYRVASGDEHPASLVEHFIAYRAGVRAKVACLRAVQEGGADTPAADDARLLVSLARRHLDAGRVRLVLVGGLPGTGKSTLATGLARATGWRVLRSDVVRKELAAVSPGTSMAAPYREGIYAPEHTKATYAELLTRATALLSQGESVILDASWTDAAWRAEAAEVAAETWSELLAVRCSCPVNIAAARMRARAGTDPSDATPDIAAALAAEAAPWPEAQVVVTDREPDDALADALRAVG